MVSLTSVSIDPWKGAHYGQQSRYRVPALVEWWDWWERRAQVTHEAPGETGAGHLSYESPLDCGY